MSIEKTLNDALDTFKNSNHMLDTSKEEEAIAFFEAMVKKGVVKKRGNQLLSNVERQTIFKYRS